MSDEHIEDIPAETGVEETKEPVSDVKTETGDKEISKGDDVPDTGKEAGDGSESKTPESYADFDLPEGTDLDTATLEQAVPVFKELGLSQEQAQKLVDFQTKQVQAGEQGRIDSFNQLISEWKEQSINDKEFGGDSFQENIGIAQAAIDKFGTPELGKLLSDHGVGNHPEVIRFMVKVGNLTKEDKPGGKSSEVKSAGDHVSVLYPETKSA